MREMLGRFLATRAKFDIPRPAFAKSSSPKEVKFFDIPSATKAIPESLPTFEAPVGQPIKNVTLLSGQPDPVAMADDQYPDWMWAAVRAPTRSRHYDAIRPDTDASDIGRAMLKRLNRQKIRENNERAKSKKI